MLRPIYIIFFLLCIEWTFSYNYIDNASGRGLHKLRRHGKKSNGRIKNRKNLLRRDYGYDRRAVEFDVASFIQPNEENTEEDEMTRQRNKKRRRLANNNEYNTLMDDNYISDITKRKEKAQDFLSFDAGNVPELNYNQPLFNDMANGKNPNVNNLDDMNAKYSGHNKYKNAMTDSPLGSGKSPVHNPAKKSAFKSIKIPFFSHNKSRTMDTKKNKKRKLFCFSCAKKDALRPPELNKTVENPALQYKIKRSYEESLCPACKKKFTIGLKPTDRRKKTARKIIHNSRQYYQKLPQVKIKEDLKKLLKYNIDDLEVAAADDRYRKKREPAKIRQLKELDEIEKKVEDVQVNVPKFERPPDFEPE